MFSKLTKTLAISFFASAIFAGAFLPSKAFAADTDTTPTVEEAMKRLSDEIARFISAETDAGGKVAISAFQGPSSSGAGARISQALRSHLEGKIKVVDLGAAYSVGGRFLGQKQSDGKFATVIEAEICDALGGSVQNLRKKIITGLDEGLAFFAPSSVDLSKKSDSGAVASKPKTEQAESDAKVAGDTLVNALRKPELHIDPRKKSILRPSQDSPYGLEVLLKKGNEYQALDLVSEGGLAKVNLGTGDVFALRLYNGSPRPVGCRLTIDGINIFALSENKAYGTSNPIMALNANGTFSIKGWHHTDEFSHEFKITNYGDSAAARFGVVEGVGAVTATFFEVIDAESYSNQLVSRDAGTGLGELVPQVYQRNQVKFGNPVGAVSARYLRPEHPADLPSE
jgi:hypothetical protein